MWFIPTKKEIKKEFEKIKDSFKKRDKEILNKADKKEVIELRDEIKQIKGAVSVLISQSQKSQSHSSLRQSQSNFETKLIQRIRKSKKSLVMAEIKKLIDSYSVIEIFEKIVKEKGLCSKASFYRYLSSLKSQNLIETETKLRLK